MLAAILVSGAAGLALLPLLGSRLLPDFRENYLIAHASLRPGISLDETSRVGAADRGAARGYSRGEAASLSRSGGRRTARTRMRPTRASSRSSWIRARPSAPTQLESRVRAVFEQFPNQLVEIYSVLAERIGETLSGEVAPFFVSVFGPDLDRDDQVAGEIAALLRRGRRAARCSLEVPPRQPELQVRLLPERSSLYGLQAEDVLATLNAAYHGTEMPSSTRPTAAYRSSRGSPASARTPGDVGALRVRGRDGRWCRCPPWPRSPWCPHAVWSSTRTGCGARS